MRPRHASGLAGTTLAVLLGLASAGFAKEPSPKAIGDWLPLLPAEVFDHTTEGIEQDELDQLRQRGSSESWKARKVSATKYLATAKRPFSEVHMSLRQHGSTAILEVLTFNEKAVDYSYWVPAGQGARLKAYEPGLFYRALNENETGKPGPSEKVVPADLRQHLEWLEACHRIATETKADAPAPRKQALAEESKARKCAEAGAATRTLQQRFSRQQPWAAVLERAARLHEQAN